MHIAFGLCKLLSMQQISHKMLETLGGGWWEPFANSLGSYTLSFLLPKKFDQFFLNLRQVISLSSYLKNFLGKLWQVLRLIQSTHRFPHFAFHTTVRDLGVTLDSALTFSQHISNLTRSSYFQLRRLRTIRKACSYFHLRCPRICLLQDWLL